MSQSRQFDQLKNIGCNFVKCIREILKEAAIVDVNQLIEEYNRKIEEIVSVKKEFRKRLKRLYEQGKQFFMHGQIDEAEMFAELYLNVERIISLLSIYEAKTHYLISTLKGDGPTELGSICQPLVDYSKFAKYFEALKTKSVLQVVDNAIQSRQVSREKMNILAQLMEYEPFQVKPISAIEIRKVKNKWLKNM
ncbi:MAG: hypothetical protein QW279_00245 [Candidatus Jordarchaeaceae archaeon]